MKLSKKNRFLFESSNFDKKTKNTSKKVIKKYNIKGQRSIALSWEGYEDLLVGTIKFNESDYKGTIKLLLPNTDEMCEGTYLLQKNMFSMRKSKNKNSNFRPKFACYFVIKKFR